MNIVKKNLAFFSVFFLIGILGTLYLFVGNPSNESLITGISGGFGVSGLLGIFLSLNLMRNPKKCNEIEVYQNEERTLFIKEKSNSKTYSISSLIQSAVTIIAALLGYKVISITIASILLIEFLIWIICSSYYGKKY